MIRSYNCPKCFRSYLAQEGSIPELCFACRDAKPDKQGEGGVKFDEAKPAVGLIPPEALEEEGYVWGFGAKKYAAHNWRKGFTTLRICGAIMRHLLAIMRGEDIDPESGRMHAAHIRCDAAMLIAFKDRKDLDDRYKK